MPVSDRLSDSNNVRYVSLLKPELASEHETQSRPDSEPGPGPPWRSRWTRTWNLGWSQAQRIRVTARRQPEVSESYFFTARAWPACEGPGFNRKVRKQVVQVGFASPACVGPPAPPGGGPAGTGSRRVRRHWQRPWRLSPQYSNHPQITGPQCQKLLSYDQFFLLKKSSYVFGLIFTRGEEIVSENANSIPVTVFLEQILSLFLDYLSTHPIPVQVFHTFPPLFSIAVLPHRWFW